MGIMLLLIVTTSVYMKIQLSFFSPMSVFIIIGPYTNHTWTNFSYSLYSRANFDEE